MTPPLHVHVHGIGLLGPGLADWASARALLADAARWVSAPTVLAAPQRLPPAERRRAGAVVKLSIAVADQACAQAGADPRDLATVFASSSGDSANCHALCEALAQPERVISPTRFTNSVHNAQAGYWHIATTSRAPSASVCAFDASFGAGLLEAASQCVVRQRPILLVASDVPYPEPLHSARPLPDGFGVALLIDCAAGERSIARIGVGRGDGAASRCADSRLEALRRAVPAARCLPLLEVLARGEASSLVFDQLDGFSIAVEVTPVD